MDNFDYGFINTPHKKPSTKKTPKKGTGKGVCQVTKKKHNFSKIGHRGPFYYNIDGRTINDRLFLNTFKVCEDCLGYKNDKCFYSDQSVNELHEKFSDCYGILLKDSIYVTDNMVRVK